MIYFSSDWHFNHTNIAGQKVSKWKDGYRNFNSVEEMNETLIRSINKTVKHDDVIWFLGDFCFGGHHLTPNWRDRLHCQTIHLLRGNHDEHIDKYADKFTSIQDYYHGKIGHSTFALFHYAMRVWYHNNKGVYHLYGHSHSSLEYAPNGRSMDVGIDNAYKLVGEYRPFSITEVVNILDKREIVALDHHTQTSNV